MNIVADYWKECISEAADECDLVLSSEQLRHLAESVEAGHDNYGMAFYSPPASDRIADIENEWKAKIEAKDRELECYRTNAETAVKRALHQHSDAQVSIGEYGEVFRHGGCTVQIL
jgi:hypothetical protein